jgi:phytoene desaturase
MEDSWRRLARPTQHGGLDLPRETALDNLWNFGYGFREYANGGVQACAESAKLAVEAVLQRFGPRPASALQR